MIIIVYVTLSRDKILRARLLNFKEDTTATTQYE